MSAPTAPQHRAVRQNLPIPARGDGEATADTLASAEGVLKGGYVWQMPKSTCTYPAAQKSPSHSTLFVKFAKEGIGARVCHAVSRVVQRSG